jgi:molybdate/tungstate transport system substrate-binding protein
VRPTVLFSCLLLPLTLAVGAAKANAEDLYVAYAGSMGAVMDLHLGPDFAKTRGVDYRGEGQGAYGLARLIADHKIRPDVFVSITPGPVEILQQAGLVREAYPVASTQMCIAYSPDSPYAKDFAAAAQGKKAWYEVLQMPGVTFGRTDPRTDPQGQNIIFTMLLAERYYHIPGLAQKILGEQMNPRQILTEPSLLTRLKSGQLAASSGYLSAVTSQKLPCVKLPPEINLSDPRYAKDWYDKVQFTISVDGKDKVVHPQPLVFYAAVLTDAPHPQLGQEFVDFLRSATGQKIFRDNGYSAPHGPAVEADNKKS